MAKKPYRKCNVCGKLVPMEKDTCLCGTYVGSQIPVMCEEEEQRKEDISGEQKYVQRCPNCGTDYFMNRKEERLERCPNCGKATIRHVEPELPKQEKRKEIDETPKEELNVSWNILLENLEKADQKKGVLCLESVGRYAGDTIKMEWEDTPILLGREAMFAEILSKDGRVSGKHCEFTWKNDMWYVRDHQSTNSTLLNEKEVSQTEPEMIKVGDSIVLGNQMDSMEFKVVSIL